MGKPVGMATTESCLWKSRIRVPYDLQGIISPGAMHIVPKDVGVIVASISFHCVDDVPGCDYISRLTFYAGINPEGGGPRTYERIESIDGLAFPANKQKIAVDDAKEALKDVSFLENMLCEYAASRAER
jgi:hypothetical protein